MKSIPRLGLAAVGGRCVRRGGRNGHRGRQQRGLLRKRPHSAIVAREYKIPAVLGIRTATTVIPNGVMITVDGNRGTVRLD